MRSAVILIVVLVCVEAVGIVISATVSANLADVRAYAAEVSGCPVARIHVRSADLLGQDYRLDVYGRRARVFGLFPDTGWAFAYEP